MKTKIKNAFESDDEKLNWFLKSDNEKKEKEYNEDNEDEKKEKKERITKDKRKLLKKNDNQ